MNIDREVEQGGTEVTKARIVFCLEQLEKASHFSKGVDWDTEICARLTVEELIGALVSAGQTLSLYQLKPKDVVDVSRGKVNG